MNVEQFLAARGLTLNAFTDALCTAVALGQSDALLAVGSLAEDLGNASSDLDVILLAGDLDAGARRADLSFVIGDLVVDVQAIGLQDLLALARRLEAWTATHYEMAHPPELDSASLRTLHRISSGTPLAIGPQCQLPAKMVSPQGLARLKYQWARYTARTILVDLRGLEGCGDWATLVMSAQDLLGHAMDALTAVHGFTNPTAKWRLPLLRLLPQDWAAALGGPHCDATADRAYWNLSRVPEAPHREASLRYAHEIASMARRIFLLGDHRFDERILPIWRPTGPNTVKTDDGKTPCLEFDVDVMLGADEYQVGRLNTDCHPVTVCASEVGILLWLDGKTAIDDVISRGAAHPALPPVTAADVARVIKRLDDAGLLRWQSL